MPMALPAFSQVRPQPSLKLSPAIQARLTRTANTKPGFINNLAAARSAAITTGQAAQFKNAPMRKFLSSLTGDKRGHTETIATADEAAEEFGIQPVSYLVPSAMAQMKFVALEGAGVRYVREPQIEQVGSNINIAAGDLFLTANRPLTIDLPYGRVMLKKDTTVNVQVDRQGGRVINVSDHQRDSVVLKVCRRTIALMPGKECTFSKSPDYVGAKHHDGCGRRAIKVDRCCTYSFKTNEVSIAALLKHHPIGYQLYRSTNESDLKLRGEMLKTAAALAFWTKSKTPYIWE
jgi:hypothetical protein